MENNNKVQRIVLRTYSKAWKFEKKVYSVGDMRLPVPLNLSQLGYFFIGVVLVFILSKIPIFTVIPVFIRYLLIPFGIMKFLTNFKHDGKLPLKWLSDWFKYLLQPKITIRGKPVETFEEIHFTNCERIKNRKE